MSYVYAECASRAAVLVSTHESVVRVKSGSVRRRWGEERNLAFAYEWFGAGGNGEAGRGRAGRGLSEEHDRGGGKLQWASG